MVSHLIAGPQYEEEIDRSLFLPLLFSGLRHSPFSFFFVLISVITRVKLFLLQLSLKLLSSSYFTHLSSPPPLSHPLTPLILRPLLSTSLLIQALLLLLSSLKPLLLLLSSFYAGCSWYFTVIIIQSQFLLLFSSSTFFSLLRTLSHSV